MLRHHSSDHLLASFGLVLVIAAPYSKCGTTRSVNTHVRAVYDKQTGRLQELIYDSNNSGKPDTWSYMDGTKVVRIEIDKNEDGLVDRWEYYGADRQLQKVGMSSANDGKADTWAFKAPDGTVGRIEKSTHRDGKVDRTEFFEKGVIVRAEQDADGDTHTDRWETYHHGNLVGMAFDTSHRGSPDRTFAYGEDGSLRHVEHSGN